MTRALFDRSAHKRRFGVALAVAVAVHLAAISLATTNREPPKIASAFSGELTEIIFDSPDHKVNPPEDPSEQSLTPPVLDESFIEPTRTPPPVRRENTRFTPVHRSLTNASSMNLSSAKVFALNAPRPEYPYEARRQKITGDGIAVLTIDSASGNVIQVAMARSTGNSFLDNAALVGFRRWRFKPGTVSSVTCPVTFTLTGASY